MQVHLDDRQTEVLGEILESTLQSLRNETSHTDSREYRARLHEREEIVESMLTQLASRRS